MSRLALLPGVNAGFFTVTSGPQSASKSKVLSVISYLVSDFLLRQGAWLNHTTVCSYPAPWQTHSSSYNASEKSHQHTIVTKPSESPLLVNSASNASQTSVLIYVRPGITLVPRNSTAVNLDNHQFVHKTVNLDELLGDYFHNGFGKISVIKSEKCSLEGLCNPKSSFSNMHSIYENITHLQLSKTSKGKGIHGNRNGNNGNIQYDSKDNGNMNNTHRKKKSSENLILIYGRFGRLSLTRSSERQQDLWTGRFVGPLWYISSSDESHVTIQVIFLRNEHRTIDRLQYPMDSSRLIVFRKCNIFPSKLPIFSGFTCLHTWNNIQMFPTICLIVVYNISLGILHIGSSNILNRFMQHISWNTTQMVPTICVIVYAIYLLEYYTNGSNNTLSSFIHYLSWNTIQMVLAIRLIVLHDISLLPNRR